MPVNFAITAFYEVRSVTADNDVDQIYGRGGDDVLDAADLDSLDTVNGGAHVTADTCTSDTGDTETNCEL
jgi:hypothetical protein